MDAKRGKEIEKTVERTTGGSSRNLGGLEQIGQKCIDGVEALKVWH